ncbi:Di-copper centre-containing protein [Aaosphaeria arxii CBS 175.79]|uniref:tyrosinase n=1 Tax=Aaosphaeria arxii CBS 175.79 TaxID=1450172 RepID=A0A6A5Y322_9PLEO|nr:Di-copper centre-containing protein [Aaosphaeria arxii CBS 175.79]KAF2019200.1 Di-copper centre-containing protein [Aaosphaeria arxii CBS 175.79]
MKSTSTPLLLFSVFSALCGSSFGAPFRALSARQEDFFPITGPAVGGIQPRLEIRDVEANGEMFNLFLLAIMRFKEMNQDDKISYFQVSGIHGQPLIDWDSSPSNGGNPDFGYCPHGSNLFGPWHRPYLSIFEQVLSQKAVEVAAEFEDEATKARYQAIAETLRLPYWDWAKRTVEGERILPTSIAGPTAVVTFPNGTEAEVENPLLLYRFNPLKEEYFSSPWQNISITVRNSEPFSEVSNPEETENFLQNFAPSLRETFYQIITQWQTYNQFSNHGSESSILGNIESIHDMVHGSFGFAHMGFPSVAAFDPVFWMHHANVDRVLAIWQHIYPDTYVEPYEQSWPGTYTIAPGSIQGPDSPLTPFRRNAQGDYHTSESSRYTDAFQYTYPELQDNPSNDTLKAIVNTLYAPAPTSALKRQEEIPDVSLSSEHHQAFLCAIEVPLQFVGIYSVEIFLGKLTSSSQELTSDPNFVGAQTVMSRAQNDQSVKGSVVLTDALRKKFDDGELKGLDTDAILEYLHQNLHWRIQKGNVEEVPKEQFPGLKISVVSTEIEPANSTNEFPNYVGGWTTHDVTFG